MNKTNTEKATHTMKYDSGSIMLWIRFSSVEKRKSVKVEGRVDGAKDRAIKN